MSIKNLEEKDGCGEMGIYSNTMKGHNSSD